MKRGFTLFFVVVVLGLLLIQCKSNEDKALSLINEQMFKTLYDFDSYQPVETKIDSAFHTPFNDSINLKYAIFCSVFLETVDDYLQQAKKAQSAVEIWSDSYTTYGRQKYFEAYDEATKALASAKTFLDMVGIYQDSIKMRSNEFDKDFMGWQVTHKFRCKTKGGYSDLSTNVYVMDKKFTKIMDERNIDDDNYKQYQNIIKEALEKEDTTDDNIVE